MSTNRSVPLVARYVDEHAVYAVLSSANAVVCAHQSPVDTLVPSHSSHSPLSRKTAPLSSSPAAKMVNPCSETGLAIGSVLLSVRRETKRTIYSNANDPHRPQGRGMELQAVSRYLKGRNRQRRLYRVRSTPVGLPVNHSRTSPRISKVWDTYSGEVLHSFPHNHIVRSVDISPDGSRIVTGDQEKKVRIFDLNKPDTDPLFCKAPTSEKGTAHEKTVKSVVWVGSATGGEDLVVSGGEDGVLQCVPYIHCTYTPLSLTCFLHSWWDLRTSNPIFSLNVPDPITSLELSRPTSTLVLTYGNSVSIHPISPSDSADAHTLVLPHAPSSASLHPTWGDRFVAGSSSDPWVRVYRLADGEELELYKGHHGPVHCVMYSPDGEMYASGSGMSFHVQSVCLYV